MQNFTSNNFWTGSICLTHPFQKLFFQSKFSKHKVIFPIKSFKTRKMQKPQNLDSVRSLLNYFLCTVGVFYFLRFRVFSFFFSVLFYICSCIIPLECPLCGKKLKNSSLFSWLVSFLFFILFLK